MPVIDKHIILGGQHFPIVGMARGANRADFEIGLKTGPANYDNREDAFFQVYNDFTGGFGDKIEDIRTKLGTYWFADPVNAPETAYMTRVTLPLQQRFVSISSAPDYHSIETDLGYPFLEWDTAYVFGLGGAIYKLDTLGDDPTRVYNDAAYPVITILSAVDPTAGLSRLYATFDAGGSAGNPLFSADGGVTWGATSSKCVTKSDRLITGNLGDLLSEDKVYSWTTGVDFVFNGGDETDPNQYGLSPTYANLKYAAPAPVFSAPPGKTVEESSVPVEDMFYYDHKVIGQWDNTKLSFLVPASGDGLAIYTIPKATYVAADNYQTISSYESGSSRKYHPAADVAQASSYEQVPQYTFQKGYVVTAVTTYTDDEKYLINEGQEAWNHLQEGDKQIVAALDIPRELRFVGVAPAPWGEPAVYLRGGHRLFVLDFFARKIYPIEIGCNKPIIQARMQQGKIVCTDGWNVYEFNPSAQNVRNIGFPRKWGQPPNLIGDEVYQIIDLIPNDDELLAVAVDTVSPATILFKHNQLGWHQVGKRMDNFFASYGFHATFPLTGSIFDDRAQAIILPGTDLSGGFGYWYFDLPVIAHTPTVGIDTFGDSGANFYTGWYDGGFFDLHGTLLRLNMDAFYTDDDDQIKIEYRLDNDPESELTASWTQCVDEDGNAAVFSNSREELFFNNGGAVRAGVAYRTVQFKITLLRGSDATHSPMLRAMTLTHVKTPALRTMWTFRIDANRMVEQSKKNNQAYYIGGQPATIDKVWTKVRSFWTNDFQLLPLEVPNVLADGEIVYVKVNELPITADDFGFKTSVKGYIDISLLEPIVSG